MPGSRKQTRCRYFRGNFFSTRFCPSPKICLRTVSKPSPAPLDFLCLVGMPKAGTTRHRITGIMTGDDFQMIYQDTPGVLTPAYMLHVSVAVTAFESSSGL